MDEATNDVTAAGDKLCELRALLEDPDLPHRCRRAAELHYALEPACDRQMMLYREILSRAKNPARTLS